MLVGIPTETFPGERRVALVPGDVAALTKAKLEVVVESGAGGQAGHPDAEYEAKGASIATRDEVFERAGLILQVRGNGSNPEATDDLERIRKGQAVVGFSDPLGNAEMAKTLAERGAVGFSMELIPRISRAQSMDALSSMATIAGYKAVLIAASELPKIFPMLMTAAGMVRPARVFVIGAGVAGLQAIATARRLGAVVEAYDVRPVVKEQVESLGAKFVELAIEATGDAEDKGGYAKEMDESFYHRQRETMTQIVQTTDVVITTAAIPGRKSPILITADMVAQMPNGSIIVDLAAERGGNCEPTKADERVVSDNGVTLFGPTNLPSTVPTHASQMYSRNIITLVQSFIKDGELHLNMEDEVVVGTLVSNEGEVVHPKVRDILGLPAKDEPKSDADADAGDTKEDS